MKKMNFTKMVASGNDFVVIEDIYQVTRLSGYQLLAQKICDRKYGIGSDGLIVLEKSKKAGIKMRIFNADGSEAEMCGNGARCVAFYSVSHKVIKSQGHKIKIETKAGIIESEVNGDNVKIKLTSPKDIKLDFPIKINGRGLKVNFINTGVPHTVIFAEGLDKFDIVSLGRQIRYHSKFSPKGTNVNFVEVFSGDSIKVRTYERGVEDETLACGTGSVASALIYNDIRHTTYDIRKINVHTQSGEILKVYFEKCGNNFNNVWLEGKAKKVYTGVLNV